MHPTAITSLLDRVDPYEDRYAEPIFDAAAMAELARTPGVEDALLAVARDPGEAPRRRFAAAEALFQGGWTGFRARQGDARAVARVLAEAIPASHSHNRWGLPGVFVGRTGKYLLSLPGAAQALAPLLADGRPLEITGSETSSINLARRYRVADLAAWLAAEALGRPYRDDPDPARRDADIAALKRALAPPAP